MVVCVCVRLQTGGQWQSTVVSNAQGDVSCDLKEDFICQNTVLVGARQDPCDRAVRVEIARRGKNRKEEAFTSP